MTRSHLRAASAVLAALLAAPAPTLAAAPDLARIDAVFARLPEGGPGCALGVYDHGEAVVLKGYGFANLEHQVPVGPDTVFNIGSVSKQFTAMSAIMLADQGKLGLDDDIRKYLPEMPDYGAPVTIRQLINHTSGIRNYFDLMFLKGLSHKDPATPDEIYSLIAGVSKTEFTPGSQEKYSNSGYFLLGRIVERVSGMSLARFEQQNIFGPLGMTHTHVHDDLGAVVPHRAYGYVQDGRGGFRAVGSQIEVTGDGAVFTTVRDLALWDADFYQGKVWRPAIKSEMLRVGKLTNGQPAAAEPGVYYAGGLNIGDRRGLKYMSHGGKDLGFMADLTRYPDQRLSVAVLCNQIFRIGDIVDGVTDQLLADRYTQPESPVASAPRRGAVKGPDELPMPATLLATAPGVYYNREIDARYVIEVRDGALALRVGPHQVKMGPLRLFEGDVLGVDRARFQLHRDAAGRIAGFTFEGFEFVRL